ncbi:hypothetical protein AB0F16_37585 [Streptomyces tanashiensis]|uniref:hypothetical protein n=1 Tax=Streptomyces tanashiensis TaxID=67367 RepID=UPI003402D0F0
MMRLPFISRSRAQAAVDLAVRGVWHLVDEAEQATCEARSEQRKAEAELTRERGKRERLKTYMRRAHTARYEQRIDRLRRAVASERAMGEAYRKIITRLTDQLLDATGYQGEPLLPAARTSLGIDVKEDEA